MSPCSLDLLHVPTSRGEHLVWRTRRYADGGQHLDHVIARCTSREAAMAVVRLMGGAS